MHIRLSRLEMPLSTYCQKNGLIFRIGLDDLPHFQVSQQVPILGQLSRDQIPEQTENKRESTTSPCLWQWTRMKQETPSQALACKQTAHLKYELSKVALEE
jgi:hypothetical protein